MKSTFKKPVATSSADNWFKVRKNKGDLPFNFKENHSRNGFFPIDFGIWSALYPKEARKHFSKITMDVFQYSWQTLAERIGVKLKPSVSISGFAENINNCPWFKQELFQWGGLLSYLWVGSFEIEPRFYKLTDRHYSKWQITKHWICEDGFTPRTYAFADLASNERFIFMKEEPSDNLSPPEDCLVSLPYPNIGTQFLGDSSVLILLQDGWGFDEKGKISLINSHSLF